MVNSKHYPNAPITEAIIDLRVEPRDGLSLDDLAPIGLALTADYPKREEIVEAIGQMELRPGVGASVSAHQKTIGQKWSNEDGNQIVQIRQNGFAYSRLAPYESWEPFCSEACRLWSVYRDQMKPRAIARLAVRYINRIDIPGSSIDLKEYFRTSPEISTELPQQLDGFFMQLRLPFPDLPGTAIINQTIIPPAREHCVSVVLDIDLFCGHDVPQEESQIWEFFEMLHDTKNATFEACVTDSARKLFKKCQS